MFKDITEEQKQEIYQQMSERYKHNHKPIRTLDINAKPFTLGDVCLVHSKIQSGNVGVVVEITDDKVFIKATFIDRRPGAYWSRTWVRPKNLEIIGSVYTD